MKKRTHVSTHSRTLRSSLMGGSAVRRVDHVDHASDENVPGLAILPGPQFDALLDMLERSPEVPVELRREVANRRWK